MLGTVLSGGSQQVNFDKDNFKRVLDIIRTRASDIDAGERESLIDCIKCDLRFC
jgi:hypothetical protein